MLPDEGEGLHDRQLRLGDYVGDRHRARTTFALSTIDDDHAASSNVRLCEGKSLLDVRQRNFEILRVLPFAVEQPSNLAKLIEWPSRGW